MTTQQYLAALKKLGLTPAWQGNRRSGRPIHPPVHPHCAYRAERHPSPSQPKRTGGRFYGLAGPIARPQPLKRPK
jgi:hypothetical protein